MIQPVRSARTPTVATTESLRIANYNASVASIERCHDDLMIMRVRPDCGFPSFIPGQYTVLGLGGWEARFPGCQPETEPPSPDRLIKRAYSISSPMLENNQLANQSEASELEFYIALVREAEHPPALTPRLFMLQPGDRIFCGSRAHGRYAANHLPRDTTAVFAATGTGEAPHNAMLTQLLRSGHRGEIINLTCVRRSQDLGYLRTHRRLESMFPRYRYIALTTREPQNLDPKRLDYVGKRYLQDYFRSGDLETECDIELDPKTTHVFLCGNPDMIGAPTRSHDPARRYPGKLGMVEVLERLGFRIDLPHEPGNLHFERFW